MEHYVWLIVGFALGFAASTVVWYKIYERGKSTERERDFLKTQLNTRGMQVKVLRNQLDNTRNTSIPKDGYGKVRQAQH